jgi:ABC-type transporter Mla subunit MlaD
MSTSSSSGSATGGLGDLLALFGQSNPLAQAGKTLGQFQKAVDDLLALVQQFSATMESMNTIAMRVNTLLDDVEPPIRALMPQVTRTIKAGDAIVDRMGSAVDLLGDLAKALQPLAQVAESASVFGLKPLTTLRENASGAADLVRRVTQFAATDTQPADAAPSPDTARGKAAPAEKAATTKPATAKKPALKKAASAKKPALKKAAPAKQPRR